MTRRRRRGRERYDSVSTRTMEITVIMFEVRKRVLKSLTEAEKTKLAHYHELFEGVYKEVS